MNNTITVNQISAWSNTGSSKIIFIKAVREITGFGLKQAKDIADELVSYDKVIPCTDVTKLSTFISDCNRIGIQVDGGRVRSMLEPYEKQLKEVASVAILSGDYMIAEDVLAMIKKYTVN